MNKKSIWLLAASMLLCGLSFWISFHDGKALEKPYGTLEEPIVVKMPDSIKQVLDKTIKVHCFDIMSDTTNGIYVSGIGELDNGVSTEGYGITIDKKTTSTTFPDVRNTRQPRAYYDRATDCLWLTSSVMEGTGVNVEQLYKIQFGTADDSARIVSTIEPFQMQQKLMDYLRYSIDGEKITFYFDGVPIAKAENTIKDMGGFDDEQPLWIGEQIRYDLNEGQPRVCFVPGIKFTTGLVLTYDDMPTFSVGITWAEDGSLTLSDCKIAEE